MKNIIINTAIAPIIGVTRNPHLDFTTIIIIINVIIIIIWHFKQSFSSCVYKKPNKFNSIFFYQREVCEKLISSFNLN